MMKNPISDFPLGIFALRSLSWIVFSGCGIETVPSEYPRGTAAAQINQLDITQNLIQVGFPFYIVQTSFHSILVGGCP